MANAAIGRVTATESKPTSCSTVRFWVHKDTVIRPFDIVRIAHIPKKPGGEPSHTYAIVQELLYITDSAGHLANYVSYDFGDLEHQPQNQRLGTTIAEAEVLYNDQEIEMPVRDGAQVEWADAEGIRTALGLTQLKQPIPAGWIQTSNGVDVPIEFDAPYLLGPEGAHLNIAGISGLATKTSYAMFLMNSIQQTWLADQRPDKPNITMIIFNVKGSDLLAIDETDPELPEGTARQWQQCGLSASPFQNVTYLYPYANRPNSGYTTSHVDSSRLQRQRAAKRAWNYFYDVETGRGRLALLFSDIDDPQSTMESIVHELPDIQVDSWADFRREIRERTEKGSTKGTDIHKQSWRKFNRLLKTRTENDLFTEEAATRVDERCQKLINHAIRDLKPGGVLVIDIEPLPDYLQCLVVGDVIQTVYGGKLGDDEDINGDTLGTVVVFADELNKYAPRSSEHSARTLTRNLLEITERGRSLGVVLFSAEQFRSGVHDRVLGNCGTNVYGRTSPVEIAKCPDYRYFPDAHKSTISRLPQGHLLLQHPIFKTSLIKARFPHPCYYQPKGR